VHISKLYERELLQVDVASCSRIFRTWLIFSVDFHGVEVLLKCYKFKFKILIS
jgi:hypothetical protein